MVFIPVTGSGQTEDGERKVSDNTVILLAAWLAICCCIAALTHSHRLRQKYALPPGMPHRGVASLGCHTYSLLYVPHTFQHVPVQLLCPLFLIVVCTPGDAAHYG